MLRSCIIPWLYVREEYKQELQLLDCRPSSKSQPFGWSRSDFLISLDQDWSDFAAVTSVQLSDKPRVR
jgi:hypothetical protein